MDGFFLLNESGHFLHCAIHFVYFVYRVCLISLSSFFLECHESTRCSERDQSPLQTCMHLFICVSVDFFGSGKQECMSTRPSFTPLCWLAARYKPWSLSSNDIAVQQLKNSENPWDCALLIVNFIDIPLFGSSTHLHTTLIPGGSAIGLRRLELWVTGFGFGFGGTDWEPLARSTAHYWRREGASTWVHRAQHMLIGVRGSVIF